jgi:hypothetical protein
MTTVVFVGPSLPVSVARTVLDAIYLPPVRQADVVSAITTYNPDIIGIIDGEFGQSLSVWHKEILYALSRGIHVFGASSMGALRAAETDMQGTVGVGEIYRMFASGELMDDDEVALAHGTADANYRALSEPMVNIRATIASAIRAGVIDEALATRLIDREKAVFFPERSYHHLFHAAIDAGENAAALERLREFVHTSRVDLKREDALAMLRVIAALPRPIAPFVPEFEFESTMYFRTMQARDRLVRSGDDRQVSLATVATHAALHSPDFNAVNAHALDRGLVEVLAEMLDIEATAQEADAEARRFCVEHRLVTEALLAAWQRTNHVTGDEFRAFTFQLARRRKLHKWLIRRRRYEANTQLVLDELRLRGEYAEWVERAASHEALLEEASLVSSELTAAAEADESGESAVHVLVDHLRATDCRVPTRYTDWSEEAGLGNVRSLQIELLRARFARSHSVRLVRDAIDAGLA